MDETTTRRARYLEDVKKLSDREIREFTYVESRDLSYYVRVVQNKKIGTLWTWRQRWIGGGKLASAIIFAAGLFLAAWRVWG